MADVPAPIVQPGQILVRTAASLISAGTERLAVESGQKTILDKARARPELVKQVIQKAQTDGVLRTLQALRDRLDSSIALGYSAAGIVIETGADVTELRTGDRVACSGTGFASHAEVLSVPKNLCVRLPDGVNFEAGAFGTLGAVALQGVRLAEPTLGESVVVIGLGLIGQLAVQLLKANGCRVFGVDLEANRIDLARQLGADAGCAPDAAAGTILDWTRGRSADAVLITAATPSNQPVELAGKISRLKGRVVAVGLVGLDVPRDLYYQRELTLKISMAYGPGRYDPEYEERGHDYPFSYVRWTEGRNVEAFLDLVSDSRVKVEPLITHRFPINEGEHAYHLLSGEAGEPYLGILLQYDTAHQVSDRVILKADTDRKVSAASAVRIGLIGAGDYARAILLPHFKAAGVEFQSIASATGVSARELGRKYGFATCDSNAQNIINDDSVNLLVIATRHDSHASLAKSALEAGRNVFVEKPLALNDEELDAILAAAVASSGTLMVGFNRRFSPLAVHAKDFFKSKTTPLSIVYRVNAGQIPRDHWVHDAREGGGRIIGEVCHMIDFMHFMTGSLTTRVYAESIASRDYEIVDEDSVLITLRFADGSNGSIAYLAGGDKSLSKERIEIIGAGRSFVIADFRSATGYHNGREKKFKLAAQDKGHAHELREVCAVVREGKPAPITLEDLATTTRTTFRIKESLRTGLPVGVNT